ncbi:hypothetical protein DFH11DRAFT_1541888 [Phellopilus nigrolimitatus]|nr:hypothetical protein DFH11DRAFT_1541888 [Phellopilus nigrolimitatus]
MDAEASHKASVYTVKTPFYCEPREREDVRVQLSARALIAKIKATIRVELENGMRCAQTIPGRHMLPACVGSIGADDHRSLDEILMTEGNPVELKFAPTRSHRSEPVSLISDAVIPCERGSRKQMWLYKDGSAAKDERRVACVIASPSLPLLQQEIKTPPPPRRSLLEIRSGSEVQKTKPAKRGSQFAINGRRPNIKAKIRQSQIRALSRLNCAKARTSAVTAMAIIYRSIFRKWRHSQSSETSPGIQKPIEAQFAAQTAKHRALGELGRAKVSKPELDTSSKVDCATR